LDYNNHKKISNLKDAKETKEIIEPQKSTRDSQRTTETLLQAEKELNNSYKKFQLERALGKLNKMYTNKTIYFKRGFFITLLTMLHETKLKMT
jgi:hypothetical protein